MYGMYCQGQKSKTARAMLAIKRIQEKTNL
jgi:hypothetical protein